MKSQQILWVLAGAGLFVWYAPDLSGGARNGAAGDPLAMEAEGDGARLAGTSRVPGTWNSGATLLTRQSDGHFYADVLVDGGEYRFLVDTGASIVALTGADARDMGLFWEEAGLERIGRGASGPVHGVPVRIPHMELGDLEARDVEAAIIPEGLGVSLLGQSFLSRLSEVSISGDRMRLGD